MEIINKKLSKRCHNCKTDLLNESRLAFMAVPLKDIPEQETITELAPEELTGILMPKEADIEESIKIVQKEKNWSREDAKLFVEAQARTIHAVRNEILATTKAKIDPLTNLYNKGEFGNALEREMARASRHQQSVSLAMLDMDHFKAINDNLGHPVGDSALKILAEIIEEVIRGEDIATRYGGEEFAIILVDVDTDTANNISERLRKKVESEFRKALLEAIKQKHPDAEQKISDQENPEEYFNEVVKGTISIGVVSHQGKYEFTSPTRPIELVEKADKALYLAKTSGRNQIAYAEDDKVVLLDKTILKNNLLKKIDELQTELKEATRKIDIKARDLERSKRTGDTEAIQLINEEIVAIKNRIKVLNREMKEKSVKLKELKLAA